MYKHFLFCSLFFFFQIIAATAQTLSGTVRTDAGEPASFVSVRLLSLPDSTLKAGTATDNQGAYRFPNLSSGKYLLQFSLIGNADAYSPVSMEGLDVQLNPVVLVASNLLQEAVVSASKPLIERQIDKVVVNVEGSALATGNNVLELLQRAPGVVVTPQGAIMLEGKSGVLLTIDGKSTQLSGDALTAFLQSIPAESISKIELIANPSSRYDAEGISGIINIRLKKNQNLGLNGVLSAGNTQSIHARPRVGLNLNYRPGKVNVFGNAGLSKGAQSVGQSILRISNGLVLDQDNPMVERFGATSVKAGADYFAGDRHTFGVLVLGNFYNNDSWKDNRTAFRNENSAVVDSTLLSKITAQSGNNRLNYNLNYRFADTSGLELTVDADYLTFTGDGNNLLENRLDGTPDVLQTGTRSDIGVWSMKTDLSKNYKNGFKLEAGAKWNKTDSENDIESMRRAGEEWQADPGRTNLFDYRENIAAAYFNLGKQGAKLNWQVGVRTEHTNIQGRSVDLYGQAVNNPDTAYTGFFPTAYLQYTLKPMHQIGLSANRRLSRPAYQDMNPFVWQSDPYNSERGNPYLRPAYTNAVELTYTYRYAASISIGYSRTNDGISTIARQQGEQAYVQPVNLNRQDNFSLNVNMPLPVKPWWEGYLWIGVWHNRFVSQLDEDALDTRTFGGGCYMSQQFKLGRGYQLEGSMWAQFPTSDGIFKNKGIYSVFLGAKKSLFHDNASLKITVNDLFRTQRWNQSLDFGGLRGTITNNWESQNLAIGFTWKFGNQSLKTRNREQGGVGDSEARIKGKKE